LDGLEPADRALVADAAVLGQNFTLAGLAAVSGHAAGELEPRLRTLVRREILALEADPRSPERGQYAFVQALIREVAYNTLARGDRKVRHLAAARFFESLGTDELAGALAGHYLAAHANAAAGPEADALAGQARIALRAAGERASSLGARDQAQGFYEQALSITTDPADQARFHTEAASAAQSVGRVEDADRHYRAALEHHRATGDRSAQAATIAGLGEALLTAYRMEPGLELLAQASTELSDLGDDAALIRLRGQLARAYFFNDEHARAVEVADGVLEAGERLDLVAAVADALITRGSALTVLGRRYEGLGAIEAGCRLAADHGFLRTQMRGLINLCSLSIDDDPRVALAAIREAIGIAERLGERRFQLFDNAFQAAIAIGDWDPLVGMLEPFLGLEARSLRAVAASDLATLRTFRGEPVGELLAQLQALPEIEGDTVRPALLATANMETHFVAGDYAVARAHAHEFARVFSQGVAEGYVLAARCALGLRDAAAARDDLERSQPSTRRGRAIDSERTGIRAGIAALEGRTEDAMAGYRAALKDQRDLGLEWYEALCTLDVAPLLDPDDPEVRAEVEPTRRILIRLRATPLIARLDGFLAASPPAPVQPVGS
ncbi:MAG: hypothetical protein ACXWQ6_10950, partial [Candidatus Limnocylindrales bacterium]